VDAVVCVLMWEWDGPISALCCLQT